MKAQIEEIIVGMFILAVISTIIFPALHLLTCEKELKEISVLKDKLSKCESERNKLLTEYQNCLKSSEQIRNTLQNCEKELNSTKQNLNTCINQKQECLNKLERYKNQEFTFFEILDMKVITPITQKVVTVKYLMMIFTLPFAINFTLSMIIRKGKEKFRIKIKLSWEIGLYVAIFLGSLFLLL